ncbi:MAG: hypothetical protein HRU19_22305 [Pseudobacteriovorax sp.]|nr:hypothetical protein [Pseudobacteriovorax sp.]
MLLVILGLLLTFTQVQAEPISSPSINPIILTSETDWRSDRIDDYMGTFSDEKAVIQAETLLKNHSLQSFLFEGKTNFGVNKKWPHWAVFAIDNRSGAPMVRYLEQAYSATDSISLYRLDHALGILDEAHLGDLLASDERPIPYRHPVFRLELTEGLNYFAVRIVTSSIVRFDLNLHHPQEFENHRSSDLLALGLLLGGIGFIVVYNLFLAISTKSRSYALYVAYAFSYMVYLLGFLGLVPYVMFSDQANSPLSSWDLYLVIDLNTICCVLFTNAFLDLRKHSKFFYWLLSAMATIAALNFTANLLFLHGSVPALKSLSIGSIVLMGYFLIGAGTRMIFKGYKPAYYFTFAWACLVVGNTIGMAANV